MPFAKFTNIITDDATSTILFRYCFSIIYSVLALIAILFMLVYFANRYLCLYPHVSIVVINVILI